MFFLLLCNHVPCAWLAALCLQSLFDSAMVHLIRIVRILSLPDGAPLLIGPACTGKKCLLRLAAFLSNFYLVELPTDPASDFVGSVKSVLRRAGTSGDNILLVVNRHDLRSRALTLLVSNVRGVCPLFPRPPSSQFFLFPVPPFSLPLSIHNLHAHSLPQCRH
jgi:hypothetical protein